MRLLISFTFHKLARLLIGSLRVGVAGRAGSAGLLVLVLVLVAARRALGAVLAHELRSVLLVWDQLDGATSLLELGARAGRDGVGADDELALELAVAEHLEQVALLLLRSEPVREHGSEVDRRAVVEHREVRHVHDRVDLLEDLVVEPDLRQAPVQRHLATFPTELARPAGARLGALVAAARRLAEARADTAAETLAIWIRQAQGLGFGEVHCRDTPRRAATRSLLRSLASAAMVALTTLSAFVEP